VAGPRGLRSRSESEDAAALESASASKTFSSEVGAGSRVEDASKPKAGAPALIPSKPERL
jgi:hypothetical protein